MPCFYVYSYFSGPIIKIREKVLTQKVERERGERERERMALEAMIYKQDPFIYGCIDDYSYNAENLDIDGYYWDSPPPSSVAHATNSSPEACGGDGSTAVASRRKRRRSKSLKNKEEMENQRMTHIAVERNRRRQMNDYLAVLRSLMPPSYAQRGDQASIVGGAINYVKELEQLLQHLQAHESTQQQKNAYNNNNNNSTDDLFSNFFTFPQYSTRPEVINSTTDAVVERGSMLADIEVTMVESHASIKILSKRRPRQLLKMVAGFQSVCLNILHLNVTTFDQSVLYSFSVKVEEECQLSTVNEIATAVHDMIGMIQEESYV